MKHTLAVLALNKPGVLARIAGLLSRRNFNIESITAGHTEESDISRLTIVVQGDDRVIDQVVKQVSKLIDVLKVERLAQNVIDRELALIKVKADPSRRSDIVDIVEIFRAHIVDVGRETMVVEMTGDEEKIDALCAVLSEHGILEMVRTGKVTLTRGAHTVKG
ncbi:acetolactate synthase small subunit [Thermodesulfitimonas autotrophica]|uniref:Acetolactate synthase small subunit n=1 Tax=Thermodesulfitimonas autotrophica TaxID=1894989 RepID=A0A3N5BV65_9THEO|nr:acetolactate synthase small subunit [Thermodesulfitimonas autotrophica]RPF49795.1 acetolactate synthase small subunit [Thermodesulfitimonas autotrophica]